MKMLKILCVVYVLRRGVIGGHRVGGGLALTAEAYVAPPLNI